MHGSAQNVPKNRISGRFDLFSDPLTHKMAPYTTKEVHIGAHILPKAYINSTTRKYINFLLLWHGNA